MIILSSIEQPLPLLVTLHFHLSESPPRSIPENVE